VTVQPIAVHGSDDEAKVAEGDVSWLYEHHRNEVFHLALRYGYGDVAWAEDVVQDVFMRLIRVRPRLHDGLTLSSWFYRVTTNCCLNKLRHESLQRSPIVRWFFSQREIDERTPERIAGVRADLTRASAALQELPPKQRIAFYMHYVDGMDQVEVAAVLGHSKGYVSKLLKRASEQLVAKGWKIDDSR
jgi:RNA polymerase sigma-70 factor (ECF subfamily)